MSDRELLELVAKAAGIGPLDFDYAQREGHGLYCGPRLPMTQGVVMAAMWTYWRPLEDDGDALRLAVKLRIDLLCEESEISAFSDNSRFVETTDGANDANAAARRAIVRAAADFAKAQP